MKARIDKIELIGTRREFVLSPGLNIIEGSITTGKTTLIKCLRGLFGSKISKFSKEAKDNINSLSGRISIGDSTYDLVRPFVTTDNAKVSIAGENFALRLPVLRGSQGEQTYGTWLLETLGLPALRVATAPTRDVSDTSLLSVNDYMAYCYLDQKQIDTSVFEHTNTFKDVKRKYVFNVIYGKYDVEIAQLEERRRENISETRRLQNYNKTVEEFLSGTAFENRAAIQRELSEIEHVLSDVSHSSISLSQAISERSDTSALREHLLELQQETMEVKKKLQFEHYSLQQKSGLIAQLQTQSRRLTKSIVAGSHLLDFDFLSCPRCGSTVDSSSTIPDVCYLCHQIPEPQITQGDLIKEQQRVDQQVNETNELIENHQHLIANLESRLIALDREKNSLAEEIDARTQRYVSEQAEEITALEHHRTLLQERRQKFQEYLELFTRQDHTMSETRRLESQLSEIDTAIELADSRVSQFNEYIAYLDSTFQELIEEIQVPSLPNPGESIIDRRTYLPIYQGRRFDELESLGLTVMVNIAHALAHQLTCMHFNLPLPNILFIDGLSDNIGSQYFDQERIKALYRCLIRISDEYSERLQIVVADNTVQDLAREYVLVTFDDNNKLIPSELLE